ncbi:MAG: CARDB domain-containing protein [Planctomycetota bacterium]|jgi:hypothetical protein
MKFNFSILLVGLMVALLVVPACKKSEDDPPPPPPTYPDLYDDGEAYRSFTPQGLNTGTPIDVSTDIRNGGDGASGSFVVDFYASTNNIISTLDNYLGSVSVGSIAGTAYADCDLIGGDTSGLSAGTYYVGWIIDANDDSFETDETNNTAYLTSYQLLVGNPSVTTYTTATFALGMTSVASGATMLYDGTSMAYDDQSSTVTLPFAFRFFGNWYTSCRVSTNGYLTFGTDGTDLSNDAIPTATMPNNLIALFWDDLIVATGNTGSTDQIYYRVDGSAPNRVFTLEYWSVSRYTEPNNTFLYGQIKLHEGINRVELCYDTLQDWTGVSVNVSCTSGIENSGGTNGYQGAPGSPNISTPPTSNYRFTHD